MGYLGATSAAEKPDGNKLIQMAIQNGGPGTFRQLLSILGHRIRRTGIGAVDYYSYGFWMPDLDPMFRKEFIPGSHKERYNGPLSVPALGLQRELLGNKFAVESLLGSHGFATSRTRAIFGSADCPDGVTQLTSVDEVFEYLTSDENLPLFGKPQSGSLSEAAIAVKSVSADRATLTLTNGIQVPARAIAEEIASDWAEGYLFQRLHQSEASLQRHSGSALACLRIVTVMTETGAEALYSVLRFPSPTAMHDGASVNLRAWALIDLEDGHIVKLRPYRQPHRPDLTHWQDKENPISGYVLPHWAEAVDACKRAHQLFPAHGLLGWDVFLTEEGALINEINSNPNHIYQSAAQRGLNNDDVRPIYERALAYANAKNGK